MKCPCDKCICIPVCRHKHYCILYRDCILLKRYEPNYDLVTVRNSDHLFTLHKILKPTTWNVYKFDKHYFVQNKD